MKVRPQKCEGLRSTGSTFLAIDCRIAAELNQAGLVRMERQRECLKPPRKRRRSAQPTDRIRIEYVVHVAEERLEHRTLDGSTVSRVPAGAGRFVLLKILKYNVVRDVAAGGGEVGGISTNIWTCSRDKTPGTNWTPSSLPSCRIIVRIRSRNAPSSTCSDTS